MTSSEAVPYTLLVLSVTVALLIFLFHLLTRGLNTSITKQQKGNSNNSEGVPVSGTPWHSSQSGTPQCFTPPLPFSHPFSDHHPLTSYCDLANWDSNTDSKKKLIQSLCREACSKAKDAGRHPSYVPLCLNLVHHYTLDVNSPVLSNGLSIFLCSCLSGCEELVSSLLPLADLTQTTDHGETALYLAVYAAAHRSLTEQAGGEVPVIRLLLEAGVEIDTPNLAGKTALQVASRKGCLGLARLLLDWGASPQEVLPDIRDAGTISDQGESLDYSLMSSYRDSSMSKTRGSALTSTTCTQRSSLNSTKETSGSVPDSPMTTRSSSLTTIMNTSGTALYSTITTLGMEQRAVEESNTAKNLGACSRDKLDMKQKDVPRIQGAIEPGGGLRHHGAHKQQGASRQEGTSKEQGAGREVGQVKEHGAERVIKKRKLFSESMGGPRILE